MDLCLCDGNRNYSSWSMVWRDQPRVRADVAQIEAAWAECLDLSVGPFYGVDSVRSTPILRQLSCGLNTMACPLHLKRPKAMSALFAINLQSAPGWISRPLRLSLWHFMNPTGWPLMLCQQRHKSRASSRFEHQRDPVDTVAHTGRRRTIVKDMSKMAAAPAAMTFCAGHEKFAINTRSNGARLCLPETGPSRPAVELMFRAVKGQVAAAAMVHSIGIVFIQW